MTVIYARLTFLFFIVFLAIQTLNIGWASDEDEKPASIRTGASTSSALIVLEKPAAITRSAPASRIPTVEEYDDAPPVVTSQLPRVEFDDHIDLSQQLPKMPFKLGFEFQESSRLCKWAPNDSRIQKKPLFSVHYQDNKKPLWHVVIDTDDIEFVTRPFSYKKEKLLDVCIQSILASFNVLRGLLTASESTSFKLWTDEMVRSSKGSPFTVNYSETYRVIENQLITRSAKGWKPKFSPQVTIQHPLERTIPLYFSLFGFDSPYMMPFSASLPCRSLLLKAQQEADSKEFEKLIHGLENKLNGLVFLHALTLVQLTPKDDSEDAECLQETRKNLNLSSQVDAKMMLTLMLRGTFSAAWKDLQINGDYATYFEKAMSYNFGFTHTFRVPERFKYLNYGEQFFDHSSGSPISLIKFARHIRQDFFVTNQEVIQDLLKRGVISTTMIRNFSQEVKLNNSDPVISLFERLYETAINSVQLPRERYIIDTSDMTVKCTPFAFDTLSPPSFLDEDNSMGRFKDEMPKKKAKYGEAIVEVRGIRDVQPWFLKKCGLDVTLSGDFLTRPGDNIRTEALGLFRFLKNFGTVSDYKEIYYLGLPFALKKY